MGISKQDIMSLIENSVKNYYLIKEYEKNGQLVYHKGWYEAKSKEAADALSSFLVSARAGNYKGNFKIKLPSEKQIAKYKKSIENSKRLD